MNFFVHQSIHINILRIGSISNSSVLQVGTAGIIKPSSHLYNTGNFIGPAPKPEYKGFVIKPDSNNGGDRI